MTKRDRAMNYEKIFDNNTIKAIKKLANGMVVTEITKEYVSDEDGDLKLIKKKVNEKMLPPNTDIVKMLYTSVKEDTNKYKAMTDEELENERNRLILEIQKEQANEN